MKPLREKQLELDSILRTHDTLQMKQFVRDNPQEFIGLSEEQKNDESYLFDLMHIYKAHLIYMGPLFFESMKYCVDQGLIKLSPYYEHMMNEAEKNQEEIQKCIMLESEVDPHLQ
jgi:hypothetical protein